MYDAIFPAAAPTTHVHRIHADPCSEPVNLGYRLSSTWSFDTPSQAKEEALHNLHEEARRNGMLVDTTTIEFREVHDHYEQTLYVTALARYQCDGSPYSREEAGRVTRWVHETAYSLRGAPGYPKHPQYHQARREGSDLTLYLAAPLFEVLDRGIHGRAGDFTRIVKLHMAGARIVKADRNLANPGVDVDELVMRQRGSMEYVRVALLVPEDIVAKGSDWVDTYTRFRDNGLSSADARMACEGTFGDFAA